MGFEIGGYELGLHPDLAGIQFGNNAVTYWGVEDIEHAYQHMLAHGAEAREAIMEVGEGIKVGSVADPFGNVIGLIYNPHFSQ